MERDDNIIKIAKDMDGKGLFALSNRFTEIFDEASRIENEEQLNNFDQKLKEFMLDLKLSDSDLHDRLVKTSAPQLLNRWKQKLYDTVGGYQNWNEDRKQKAIDEKAAKEQSRMVNVRQSLTDNGFIDQINQFQGYLGQFSQGLEEIVNNETLQQIIPLMNKAKDLKAQSVEDIQTLIAQLKKSKNYNDKSLAITIEQEAKAIFQGMDKAIATLDDADASQNTINKITDSYKMINQSFQKLVGQDDSGTDTEASPAVDAGVPASPAPAVPASNGAEAPASTPAEVAAPVANVPVPPRSIRIRKMNDHQRQWVDDYMKKNPEIDELMARKEYARAYPPRARPAKPAVASPAPVPPASPAVPAGNVESPK